jgi:hypothetical protein
MSPKLHLAQAIVVAITIGLGLPGFAAAQDADAQEVSRYVLTDAGLAKYTQATKNLAAAPGACVERDDDDGSASQSIDQVVAKLNAAPGAQAAIQSAGMTSREYVVFTFAMMQSGLAGWAASQPGGKLPPGISQANVDFVKKHESAIAAIGENDPCDDAGDAEEEDVEDDTSE